MADHGRGGHQSNAQMKVQCIYRGPWFTIDINDGIPRPPSTPQYLNIYTVIGETTLPYIDGDNRFYYLAEFSGPECFQARCFKPIEPLPPEDVDTPIKVPYYKELT